MSAKREDASPVMICPREWGRGHAGSIKAGIFSPGCIYQFRWDDDQDTEGIQAKAGRKSTGVMAGRYKAST
jgi:hypothetical protein